MMRRGVSIIRLRCRTLLILFVGLLNHNWTAWRDPDGINSVIIPMVAGTKTF